MFQKLQKKIKEFFSEKGQGVVEYALILGFVAVLAIYIITGSNLKDNVNANIDNANTIATTIDAHFDNSGKKPTS